MTLPREYISHNQLRLFRDCPQRYAYAYIDRIPTRLSDKLFLGIVFHSLADEILRRRISAPEMTLEESCDLFADRFRDFQKDKDIHWLEPMGKVRDRGRAFVRHFAQQVAPTLRPIMTEKELTTSIPGGPVLKGVVDLVEDDFSISDFKTTTARWPASRARNPLQMLIYRYLFRQTFGTQAPFMRYLILYGKTDHHVRHQVLDVIAGSEGETWMLEVIGHVCAQIERGHFPRQPGFGCRFCEYAIRCPRQSPRAG